MQDSFVTLTVCVCALCESFEVVEMTDNEWITRLDNEINKKSHIAYSLFRNNAQLFMLASHCAVLPYIMLTMS